MKQKSRGIKVKTVKLSTYIHKPVDLLKIDTEGAELEILQDLYHTSKKFNLIKNIVLEYHPVKNSA